MDIEKAQDLDQMIACHNKYVNTIYERCLFHKKVAFLKDAVMGVLNLVLIFQALWDKGIDEIRYRILASGNFGLYAPKWALEMLALFKLAYSQ